ncbi:hypothetical protein [Actinomadura flavalba]|uniref:hypothetical protein n=1 Tax=Actinomadura flavalba TaxID=1120938 RepID=UPI00039C5EA9|nr:hypothetical protein [Actinomadura flavalba]
MAPPGNGGKSSYDHAQIKDVARRLQRELDALAVTGTPAGLAARGALSPSALGQWDAAQALHATVNHSNQQIVHAYEKFVKDFREVTMALEKIANNYRESDAKMLAEINAVGNGLDGRPPTRSSAKPVE